MNFYEWLKIGIENKWVSDVVCNTHEGLPMTEEEVADWNEGFDNCQFAIRVWED